MPAAVHGTKVVFQSVPRLAAEQEVTVRELLAECLDAHADTLRLARLVLDSPEWEAHRAYLSDLERVGRATLARLPDDARGAGIAGGG
jgi:hypothetical protein